MPELLRFALPKSVEVNPPQQDVAEEHAQRFRQFLVQFDNDRFVQEIFQLERVPRIKCAPGGAKSKCPQNPKATKAANCHYIVQDENFRHLMHMQRSGKNSRGKH